MASMTKRPPSATRSLRRWPVGVATAVLGELSRLAYERGLTRLTAKTSTENVASQRVLEKSNFHVIGTIDVADRPGIAYERMMTVENGQGELHPY
jgi:ribosomal-protein-alanine N-acetyltransferase